jgi:hypothetical protein
MVGHYQNDFLPKRRERGGMESLLYMSAFIANIFYYFMFHWRCFVAHSFIFYISSLIDINRLGQYIKAKEDRRNNNGATIFFLKRSKCFTGQHQWHSKVKLKRTHTVSDDGPTMTYKSNKASPVKHKIIKYKY